MSDTNSDRSSAVRTVVILGAAGYLGGALCQFFRALPRHRVVAVSRGQLSHSFFDEHLTADVFADDWAGRVATETPVVLINCAFDFKGIESGSRAGKFEKFERNRREPRAIALGEADQHLSMSAFPGCRTDYGWEKMLVETLFNRLAGSTSGRPDRVVAPPRRRLPKPDRDCHRIEDRAYPDGTRQWILFLRPRGRGAGIYVLMGMKLNKPHTLSFCYRERLELREILQSIERRRNVRSLKVPVPWKIAYRMLRVKETLIGRFEGARRQRARFCASNPRAAGRGFFAGRLRSLRRSGEFARHRNPIRQWFYS